MHSMRSETSDKNENMKTGILIKVHDSAGKQILAVADKELIGKKFEEGETCLEITESFYKGEEKTEEETIKAMKNAANINLVGKKAIALGIKAGIITKDSVIKIKEIPHAISIR